MLKITENTLNKTEMKNKEAAALRLEAKDLFQKIENKGDMKLQLADKYDVAPITVSNHWFGPLTAIPKKNIAGVIEDLKNAIPQI